MIRPSKSLQAASLLDRRSKRAHDVRHPEVLRRIVEPLEVDDLALDSRQRLRQRPSHERHDAIETRRRGELSNALRAYQSGGAENENGARRFCHSLCAGYSAANAPTDRLRSRRNAASPEMMSRQVSSCPLRFPFSVTLMPSGEIVMV